MEFKEAPIKGVYEIYPKVYKDERGHFLETFKKTSFQNMDLITEWVQDNESFSKAGVLRGLHFQTGAFAQAKLVRAITGKILDVCVDLRKGSPTFGGHYSVVLDHKQHNMLYIPAGFAHGFSVLEDAVVSYKCSRLYYGESEGGIIWNDKKLNIDWKVATPILSEKDLLWPHLDKVVKKIKGGL